MVETAADPLSVAFAALADPTRRAILEHLAAGEACVGDLARPFEITPPAISRHLKVLERAGLVTRRAERQQRIICLNPQALKRASEWVDSYRAFWEAQLDSLDTFLQQQTKETADGRDGGPTRRKRALGRGPD